MNPRIASRIAAAVGLVAVALGAFGAHAFRPLLAAHQMEPVWQTAAHYHLIHAVMLYLLAAQPAFRPFPWFCFLVGILLFSGSLYILALTGVTLWGAVTPFGGGALLAGWVCLVVCGGKPVGVST